MAAAIHLGERQEDGVLIVDDLRPRVFELPLFRIFHDACVVPGVDHQAVNPLGASYGGSSPYELRDVHSKLLLLLLLALGRGHQRAICCMHLGGALAGTR